MYQPIAIKLWHKKGLPQQALVTEVMKTYDSFSDKSALTASTGCVPSIVR